MELLLNDEMQKPRECPIMLNYSNRTGAYMDYWSQTIGERVIDLIPKDLQNELKKECDALIQDKQKLNYRNPKLTNKDKMKYIKIQDLIEPHKPTMDSINKMSAKTIARANSDLKALKKDEQFSQQDVTFVSIPSPIISFGRRGGPVPNKPTITDKMFLMIPTVFELNKETNLYEIRGEINDLPKQKHLKMYGILEKLFNCMEENIRKCVTVYPKQQSQGGGYMGGGGPPILTVEDLEFEPLPKPKQEKKKKKEKKPSKKIFDKYYVVVKMTNYEFMHQTKSYYVGGNYHSEGFEQEHIKGVALYYFDYSDNIEGGGLSFNDPTYRHFGGSSATSIWLRDNDCVFFTNDQPYKHKVDKMNISGDKAKPLYKTKDNEDVFASRKLLGMFIVDPNKLNEVKSSLDVMVNFEDKVLMIVCRWMKEYDVEQNKDIVNLICIFVCGDMEFIKMATDENRRHRYEFGQKIIAYDEAVVQSAASAMAGVCD